MHYALTLICLMFICQSCVPHKPVMNDTSNFSNATSSSDADSVFHEAKFKEAASLYKVKIVSHPDDYSLKFKLAESLRLSNQLNEAIIYYTPLVSQKDFSFAAQEGLALTYLQQKDTGKAKDIFLQLLEKDASRWRTLNALGIINSLEGNKDAAKEYFDFAQSLAPSEPAILNNLGLTLALSETNTINAIQTLQEALNLSHTKTDKKQISLNLALAYGMNSEDDKVKEILSEYLTEAEIYNNLGVYASLRNEASLARSYLSKALTSQPVFYERAWNNLEKLK